MHRPAGCRWRRGTAAWCPPAGRHPYSGLVRSGDRPTGNAAATDQSSAPPRATSNHEDIDDTGPATAVQPTDVTPGDRMITDMYDGRDGSAEAGSGLAEAGGGLAEAGEAENAVSS